MAENKSNLFNEIKNKTGKVDYDGDYGIVNPNSHASILARDDGNVVIASDSYTQFKLDKNASSVIQNSLSSISNSVTKEINSNDITINKHKFNNQLIDLTDFRNVNGNILGSIMINGTILVKTWEPNLEKWVLIRRPISTAMFSNRLNIPNTPEQLEVDLKIEDDVKNYYIDKQNNQDKQNNNKEK